jgi:amino acid transporter
MSNQKKFGTFAGVFTPSLLTILGVIMYLRMGWVVGNAGLLWTFVIILFAHLISVTTGLSISSISTDKKVGAGGVYYVLSRSLGLPMGGALGITLFTATAFSIALYMVGFAEIFNQYIGFGYIQNESGYLIKDPVFFKNSLRITGSLGLLALTILAFISTAIALKSQFVILFLIVLSLFAIFIGDTSMASQISYAPSVEKASFFEVFAIFFPAVTGFTAGIAMSGDLKNSKKSIPYGTLLSIAVGLLVYIALAIFLGTFFTDKELIENENLLYKITIYGGIFVFLGVWGATLSSALGGILGGPRILQAMSVDKITPSFFAKGVGQGNEPQRALILTVILAEAGILIGDLNIIAEVVSMFYLSAYGFINLSFFLESWASADFNPSFKVNKWVGLIGFFVTFAVMSQLNMGAMIAAFVIIGGIYFYLNKKQVSLGTGDIWQSVWSTIVKKGLRKMESGNDHIRNWKPNILLFSGGTEVRSKLIEFSKDISGQTGIITNFDLIENLNAEILFPKRKQSIKDEELDKFGIFGRQIEVQNEFKGIESIASTFGFSGIEPNTTLMPWPGETKDPIWFTQMTQKLIELDYNVLYLDYDKRWGFRKKEKIDLWWRAVDNNAELMLSLVKFIKSSPDWIQASTRILLVNDSNLDNSIIETRVNDIVSQFRIECDIKIVNNSVDKKPIYELMKVNSIQADLVFVGIPDIDTNQITDFVTKTNQLVNTIGTTLLVKASTHFKETDLKIENVNLKNTDLLLEDVSIEPLSACINETVGSELAQIDSNFEQISQELIQGSIQEIENFHHNLISKNVDKLDAFLDVALNEEKVEDIEQSLNKVLQELRENQNDACEYQLPLIHEKFQTELNNFLKSHDEVIFNSTSKIQVLKSVNSKNEIIDKKKNINLNSIAQHAWVNGGLISIKELLLEFGYENFILLHQSKNIIHEAVWQFVEDLKNVKDNRNYITNCKSKLDNALLELDKNSLDLTEQFYKKLRNLDRNFINQVQLSLESQTPKQKIVELYPTVSKSLLVKTNELIDNFPIYWKRNIILFSYHLQADLYLIQFSTGIKQISNNLLSASILEHKQPIAKSIVKLKSDIEQLTELVTNKKLEEIDTYHFSFTEDLFLNSDQIIKNLQHNIQVIVDRLPEEVELLTATSLNNIKKEQGSKVVTNKIKLDDITDYITKINFVKPFQDELNNYFVQLKQVMAILLNSSFHIQSNLDQFSKSNDLKNLDTTLLKSSSEITEAMDLLHSVTINFEAELNNFQKNLSDSLEINKIIEQFDSLNQNVNSQKKSNGLNIKIRSLKKRLSNEIHRLARKVIRKKNDASSMAYQQKFDVLQSQQSVFLNFIETISASKTVAEKLPFYYQQLFDGKHVSDNNTIDNRANEIDQIILAKDRLKSNYSGAILILGAAQSGKSFLANHTCNKILDGKIYKINAQLESGSDKTKLLSAFQNSTGIKGSFTKILNKVDNNSTFLIEDIEQYWLRKADGNQTLDELAKIIEKFGSKHYFVLTSNIYSYQTLSKFTSLKDQIIESVILPPLSTDHIADVIKSRHSIGGFDFVYNEKEEKYLSASQKKKIFNLFASQSNGNIGIALKLWIANIDKVEENKIWLIKPELIDFPELTNDLWKNLIYQFQLHGNLTRNELYLIYGESNKSWLNRAISNLLKSKILKVTNKNTFELNTDLKPFIETYLYGKNR